MEVRLLGTGGWLPTDARETACVYARDGSDLLLLDAGTGLRRLVTQPELMEGVERLYVALSHFHLDHMAGLIALPGLSEVPVREIWLPARTLAGVDAAELLVRVLGPPFLARDAGAVETEVFTAVHDLEGTAEISTFRVETRVQPLHPGSTIGMKVNGELAYCTDTAYDPETAAFARGARVLLHEAFWAGEATDDPAHSASGEAARVASDAGVDRLVLVHVNPVGVDEGELLQAARDRFPASEVGRDGLVVM